MRISSWMLAAALALGVVACSNNNSNPTPDSGVPDSGVPDSGVPDSGVPDGGAQLTISNFTFSPADFTVPAGAVITVTNDDSVAHTVTSETTDGAFSPGAVNGVSFDTGQIAGGSTATLTLPANAPSGTVIPYYCQNHTSGMSPPNGHITIQ